MDNGVTDHLYYSSEVDKLKNLLMRTLKVDSSMRFMGEYIVAAILAKRHGYF